MTPCSPPPRRGLATRSAWPVCAAASLDGVCARRHRFGRSGRRNGPAVEQRNLKKGSVLRRGGGPVSLFDLLGPFLRPDPCFALGLVSRRGQGWPLRRECGVH